MYNYPQMSAADSYSDKPIWLCKDEYCMKYDSTWSLQYFCFSGEKLVKDKEHVAHVLVCTDMHSHLPHVSLLGTVWQENSCRYLYIYTHKKQSFKSNLQLHCVWLREQSFSFSICNQ